MTRRRAGRPCVFATPALTAQAAAPAPEPPSRDGHRCTVGADIPSVYFFRGYRQESDPNFTFQPFVDVGVAASDKVSLNVGLWNSLHTGSLNDAIGSGYYETDFYAAATRQAASRRPTPPTPYPKIDDSTIHELMLSASARRHAGAVGRRWPSSSTRPAGVDKGVYLELGIDPRCRWPTTRRCRSRFR